MFGIAITLMIVLVTVSSIIVLLYYKRYRFKFPFKDTIGKVGLPVVSFEQNGNSFNFIIDSGADSSVLNTSFLTKLDYTELKGNRFIYGIDGNQVQTSYVGIKLFYQNHKFVEAFQVLDVPGFENIKQAYNMEIAGILGGTFLKRYGFLIDYKQLKAYTNGKENKIANT